MALHTLGSLPDLSPQTLEGVVSACISAHESVVALSKRFQAELSRTNYVTPTLYLNLLALLRAHHAHYLPPRTPNAPTISPEAPWLHPELPRRSIISRQLP